jgi:hypothetical protein
MKFKYLVIVLAVGSLFGLYALSFVSQPTVVLLSKIPDYDGQHVVVQGMVTGYRTTTMGSQIITLRDTEEGTASVILYVEGEVPVQYGDIVKATGDVQQYNQDWEVSVSNPQFITIVQRWGNQSFPLWQLAENPDKYVNTNVHVIGVVDQIHTSSLILSDPTGKYCLSVSFESTCPHQVSKGDTVTVKARFFYEAKTLQFVLKATEPTHGIWKE